VNRSGIGDDRVRQFCREQTIPLLAEIPDDRKLAELHTHGGVAVRDLPSFAPVFLSLADKLQQQVPV
jgi:MinD superfamily P-loop ATPase